MMDTSYRGLPTELLENILSILSQEHDFFTLKLCSYVNRLFCDLSQTHLLRNINFHQESGSSTITPYPIINMPSYNPALHFLDVLDASPHIVSYAQGLTLTCAWICTTTGLPKHWLQTDIGLPILLPQLINLRRLSIPGKRIMGLKKLYRPLWWSMFSAGFKTALITALTSNILTELDITGLGLLPSNLFRYCSSLKRLSITTLRIDDSDRQTASDLDYLLTHGIPYSEPSQLEYLHLEDMSGLEQDLTWFSSTACPLDITRLQTLSLFPEAADDMGNIGKFSTIVKNLAHLRIDTNHSQVHTSYNTLSYTLHQHFTPPPDLRGFETLQSLTIDAKFTVRIFHHRILIDYFTSPIPWISQILRDISETAPLGRTHLSRLALNLSFVEFPSAIVALLHNNWVQLVDCVSKEKFPRFSALELNIKGLDAAGLAILRKDEALRELEATGALLYT